MVSTSSKLFVRIFFVTNPATAPPFGQYLLLNKDTDTFADWLKEEIKANKKQAGDCAKCIQEWSEAFIM